MTKIDGEKILKEIIKEELVFIIARKLWRELDEKKTRLRHMPLLAAIGYISFIKANQSKSLDEISELFQVERKEVGRTYRKIKRILGMNYCEKKEMSMMGSKCLILRKPQDFIKKVEGKVSKKCLEDALRILKKAEDKMDGNPVIICGSAVWLSSSLNNEKTTQEEIKQLFNITTEAIRMNSKKLSEFCSEKEKRKYQEHLKKWEEIHSWRECGECRRKFRKEMVYKKDSFRYLCKKCFLKLRKKEDSSLWTKWN